jgi:osmotically-inducible protein OsmY
VENRKIKDAKYMKNNVRASRLLLSLALTIGAVTAFTGCNQSTNNPPDRTAGQYVDDKTLTANVKTALSQNPDYKFGNVNVNTMTGTVQLSGFVDTEDQKTKAEQIAKGVQGVKDVEDKIAIKPAQ